MLLSQIWSVLTPRQRRWVLLAQALSILMAFSTVVGIASIGPFFAVLGNPGLIERSAWLGRLYHLGFASAEAFTVTLGLAFVALVLLANLINMAGTYLMIRLASWIGTDLQSSLFAEYLHRPYLFHTRARSALLFKNVTHETTRVTNHLLQNLFALTTNVVTAAFIVAAVAALNPAVAVSLLAALAGGYCLIYLAVRNQLLRAGEAQSQLFTEQTRIVNESLGAIKEILILGIQDLFRDSFRRSSRGIARIGARTQLIGQTPRYVMECVAVTGLVGVALLAGRREDGIRSWLGQLTFIGFAAYRLLPALQQAFAAIVRVRADRAGFGAIAPDLLLARRRRPGHPAPDPFWTACPRAEIRLEHVSFSYESGRAAALSDLSLRLPAGTAVGLVGPNGSGKTTLVDVIAGLLVPAAGRVEIDGVALDETNRAAWQSRIAYLPQDVFLLDTSIAQNVALGVPLAAIDRGRLRAAARLAQLDELVARLPEGYQQVVGERGNALSGGQRQRIGIARALYTDASVLILDEATHSLDGLTEQELMATVLRLRGRYTVIVIAHHLGSVRSCDQVIQLEAGRLAASGTYAELLRSSATFRRLAGGR